MQTNTDMSISLPTMAYAVAATFGFRLSSAMGLFYGRTGYPLSASVLWGFYTWHESGLLESDNSRDITNISYNRMGLPTMTEFTYGSQAYKYDAGGGLLRKENTMPDGSVSHQTYSGDRIFSGDSLTYSYFPGGYFDGKGGVYYTHADYLGSITMVTDATGNLVQHTGYYPYGEPWREPSGQPRLYGGKERERFMSLNDYDFHARRLNSATTLWNAPDPLAGNYTNLSPYVYCAANPIMYADPSGRKIKTNIDGVDYEYRNGNNGFGFYDSDKKLYDGNDGFAICLEMDLAKLASKPMGFARSMTVIMSSDVIEIQETDYGNSYNESSNVVKYNINSGAQTYVFNENDDGASFQGRPDFIGLGHELLGHAFDDVTGDYDKGTWYTLETSYGKRKVRNAEKSAIRAENSLRAEHGLPMRVGYNSKDYPTKGTLYKSKSDVESRPIQWLQFFGKLIKGLFK